MFINGIAIQEATIDAALEMISNKIGGFTSSDVAAVIMQDSNVRDRPKAYHIASEAANRLLQGLRKRNKITFIRKKWYGSNAFNQ